MWNWEKWPHISWDPLLSPKLLTQWHSFNSSYLPYDCEEEPTGPCLLHADLASCIKYTCVFNNAWKVLFIPLVHVQNEEIILKWCDLVYTWGLLGNLSTFYHLKRRWIHGWTVGTAVKWWFDKALGAQSYMQYFRLPSASLSCCSGGRSTALGLAPYPTGKYLLY